MTTTKNLSPRQKKLDAMTTKLARFLFQETYTDEPEAQALINEAIKNLDAAIRLLKEAQA